MKDYLNKRTHIQSSKLYANSNFVIGMGSVFNILGSYFDYNYSKSEIESDNDAIKRDWEVIGGDLTSSIHTIAK